MSQLQLVFACELTISGAAAAPYFDGAWPVSKVSLSRRVVRTYQELHQRVMEYR